MFVRKDGVLMYVNEVGEYNLTVEENGMMYDGYGAITAAQMARDHAALAVLVRLAPGEYFGIRDATDSAAGEGDLESLDILLDDDDREWDLAMQAAARNGHKEAVAKVYEALVRVRGKRVADRAERDARAAAFAATNLDMGE